MNDVNQSMMDEIQAIVEDWAKTSVILHNTPTDQAMARIASVLFGDPHPPQLRTCICGHVLDEHRYRPSACLIYGCECVRFESDT